MGDKKKNRLERSLNFYDEHLKPLEESKPQLSTHELKKILNTSNFSIWRYREDLENQQAKKRNEQRRRLSVATGLLLQQRKNFACKHTIIGVEKGSKLNAKISRLTRINLHKQPQKINSMWRNSGCTIYLELLQQNEIMNAHLHVAQIKSRSKGNLGSPIENTYHADATYL